MSVRTDTVNLIVKVNGNEAQNNLINLKKKAADLSAEMTGLKKNTAEFKAKAAELKEVTKEMDLLKKQIGITALNQKELTAELSKLKALKGSVIPFTQEYKDLETQIGKVESRLYDVRNGTTGFASFLGKLSDGVKEFGFAAAAFLAIDFIATQVTSIVKGAAKTSDALADLRRVAGLTADDADRLNSSFKELDTRTSTTALREIAVIAGKLGVAKDDIYDFTAAVDQLVVSLGDELGDADAITTKLGKILNVFEGEVTGENISLLGNSFVELANAGVASGGFISDFTQRVAGIAKSSGISLGATVGLGAGLEELGLRSESGATAIQSLISTIASDLPKAAKIAGATSAAEIQKFASTFANAPAEAVIQFAEGLTKNKSSFSEIALSFKDAGEEGARVVGVLQALGQQGDFMRSKIDLGNESLTNTAAISNAFALKNDNFGASLDKLGKEFNRMVSSPGVTRFLEGAVEGSLRFIETLKSIPQFLDENTRALQLLGIGIALLNLSYIKSATFTVIFTARKYQLAIATRATALATALAEVAQASYIVVTNLLTGRITLAIAAQRLWNIALSVGAGPIGIIIALVGAAVVAYNTFAGSANKATDALALQAEATREANQETSKQRAEMEGLTAVAASTAVSIETKKNALMRLIALSPEYLNRLTLENIATADGKSILDAYNRSLQASANIKAANKIQEREQAKDTDLRTIKQELEIYKTTRNSSGLGDASRDALQQGSGADNIGSAIAIVQKKIDAQSKNVEAATANFVTQTKNQEDARRQFLIHDITLARQEQNQTEKNTAAYVKATTKLSAARAKFDKEFGYKSDKPDIVADVVYQPDKSKDKTKAAADKKDANEFLRIKKEALKFEEELQKLKERATIKGQEPQQQEIDAALAKYAALSKTAKDYYLKHAIDQKQFNADEKLIAEAQAQELQNIFDKFYKKKFEEDSAKEYEDSLAARSDFSNDLKIVAAKEHANGRTTKTQYALELKQIDLNENSDRVQIAEDYSATVKKAAKDVRNFRKKNEAEITNDIIAELDKRAKISDREALAAAQRKVLTTRRDPKQNLQAQKDLLTLQMELEIAAKELTNEELLLVQEQFQADSEALDQQYLENRIQGIIGMVQKFKDALTGLNQFVTNKETTSFNKEKANNEKKKAGYKDQLDNKLISKTLHDKKVSELDAELDRKDKELKLKQAKRERALNVFQAIINTASAIAEALPVIPLAVIAGVLGGIQIAAIASAPLPEMGDGDWIRKGAKHKDKEGGIPIMVERDEAVMKANAMTSKNVYTVTGNTAQITSALNSKAGGANWAGGAVIQMPKWRAEKPASINPGMPRVMEQGGIVRSLNTANEEAGTSTETNKLLQRLISCQLENTAEIKTMKTRLHAIVSIKEFDNTRKQYDQAKKASGLG